MVANWPFQWKGAVPVCAFARCGPRRRFSGMVLVWMNHTSPSSPPPGWHVLHATTAEGVPFNNLYHLYFEITDGRITRAREYNDTAHVFATLRAGQAQSPR